MLIKTKIILCGLLMFQAIYSMEEEPENKSNLADKTIEIVVDQKTEANSRIDPRNRGDYSIWFQALYPYPEKFLGKKSEEVEGVLKTMITEQNTPIAQKENLEKLRKAISENVLHEEIPTSDKRLMYVTCSGDKVVGLRAALEQFKELVAVESVHKLAEKNYDQQVKVRAEHFKAGLLRLTACACVLCVIVGCVVVALASPLY